MKDKLKRSYNNRMLGGVCAGLADYFETDPTLVRLVFVLFLFAGGGSLLAYIILWLVIPCEGKNSEEEKSYPKHRGRFVGIVLIAFGVAIVAGIVFEAVIPVSGVMLIAFGVLLLISAFRRR